ncbi:MAG: universal stress protein [Caldilineaceae bacterium]
MADDLRLQHFRVKTAVTIGPPASRIIDYAQENGVDLIVMSTHGRTGIARWVYGSVADKGAITATCPVYLVQSSIKQGQMRLWAIR